MATTSWTNFAGDQSCEPASFERPAGTAQVAAAIGRAAETGRTVRVAGAGHSFSDAVLTDGTLLSLERMDRVLDVDREIRARPGRGGNHPGRAQRGALGRRPRLREPRRHRRAVPGRRRCDRHPRHRRRPRQHLDRVAFARADPCRRQRAGGRRGLRSGRLARLPGRDRRPRRDHRGDPAGRPRLHAGERRGDGPDRGDARRPRRARRRQRPLRLLHLPPQRPGDDEDEQPDRHRAAAPPATHWNGSTRC